MIPEIRDELAQALRQPGPAVTVTKTTMNFLYSFYKDKTERIYMVFCGICGTEWQHKGYHPGKSLCLDCENRFRRAPISFRPEWYL